MKKRRALGVIMISLVLLKCAQVTDSQLYGYPLEDGDEFEVNEPSYFNGKVPSLDYGEHLDAFHHHTDESEIPAYIEEDHRPFYFRHANPIYSSVPHLLYSSQETQTKFIKLCKTRKAYRIDPHSVSHTRGTKPTVKRTHSLHSVSSRNSYSTKNSLVTSSYDEHFNGKDAQTRRITIGRSEYEDCTLLPISGRNSVSHEFHPDTDNIQTYVDDYEIVYNPFGIEAFLRKSNLNVPEFQTSPSLNFDEQQYYRTIKQGDYDRAYNSASRTKPTKTVPIRMHEYTSQLVSPSRTSYVTRSRTTASTHFYSTPIYSKSTRMTPYLIPKNTKSTRNFYITSSYAISTQKSPYLATIRTKTSSRKHYLSPSYATHQISSLPSKNTKSTSAFLYSTSFPRSTQNYSYMKSIYAKSVRKVPFLNSNYGISTLKTPIVVPTYAKPTYRTTYVTTNYTKSTPKPSYFTPSLTKTRNRTHYLHPSYLGSTHITSYLTPKNSTTPSFYITSSSMSSTSKVPYLSSSYAKPVLITPYLNSYYERSTLRTPYDIPRYIKQTSRTPHTIARFTSSTHKLSYFTPSYTKATTKSHYMSHGFAKSTRQTSYSNLNYERSITKNPYFQPSYAKSTDRIPHTPASYSQITPYLTQSNTKLTNRPLDLTSVIFTRSSPYLNLSYISQTSVPPKYIKSTVRTQYLRPLITKLRSRSTHLPKSTHMTLYSTSESQNKLHSSNPAYTRATTRTPYIISSDERPTVITSDIAPTIAQPTPIAPYSTPSYKQATPRTPYSSSTSLTPISSSVDFPSRYKRPTGKTYFTPMYTKSTMKVPHLAAKYTTLRLRAPYFQNMDVKSTVRPLYVTYRSTHRDPYSTPTYTRLPFINFYLNHKISTSTTPTSKISYLTSLYTKSPSINSVASTISSKSTEMSPYLSSSYTNSSNGTTPYLISNNTKQKSGTSFPTPRYASSTLSTPYIVPTYSTIISRTLNLSKSYTKSLRTVYPTSRSTHEARYSIPTYSKIAIKLAPHSTTYAETTIEAPFRTPKHTRSPLGTLYFPFMYTNIKSRFPSPTKSYTTAMDITPNPPIRHTPSAHDYSTSVPESAFELNGAETQEKVLKSPPISYVTSSYLTTLSNYSSSALIPSSIWTHYHDTLTNQVTSSKPNPQLTTRSYENATQKVQNQTSRIREIVLPVVLNLPPKQIPYRSNPPPLNTDKVPLQSGKENHVPVVSSYNPYLSVQSRPPKILTVPQYQYSSTTALLRMPPRYLQNRFLSKNGTEYHQSAKENEKQHIFQNGANFNLYSRHPSISITSPLPKTSSKTISSGSVVSSRNHSTYNRQASITNQNNHMSTLRSRFQLYYPKPRIFTVAPPSKSTSPLPSRTGTGEKYSNSKDSFKQNHQSEIIKQNQYVSPPSFNHFNRQPKILTIPPLSTSASSIPSRRRPNRRYPFSRNYTTRASQKGRGNQTLRPVSGSSVYQYSNSTNRQPIVRGMLPRQFLPPRTGNHSQKASQIREIALPVLINLPPRKILNNNSNNSRMISQPGTRHASHNFGKRQYRFGGQYRTPKPIPYIISSAPRRVAIRTSLKESDRIKVYSSRSPFRFGSQYHTSKLASFVSSSDPYRVTTETVTKENIGIKLKYE